ncbi:MAG TPA: bifunctional (p)ppGpp synthetase/guanosine-3',5'-bis(diphosphate) 3'-pyrophosphohydrolase [Candidatus Peregrinibacteria bacterium]|nr:bifunctional (p)ppGpp synthetase/guanosine-3',5'-bis(diphosphate) 3'-pyrophosphohydrolase [Candidatus Peregrinibacteria bacterium]
MDIKELLEKVGDYNYNQDKILEAFEYAKKAHEGQVYITGESYIERLLQITDILLTTHPDCETVCACLLQDAALNNDEGCLEIEKLFGKSVCLLVKRLREIKKVQLVSDNQEVSVSPTMTTKEQRIRSLRKMFLAMAEDLRVVFIEAAERVYEMQVLKYRDVQEQEQYAEETLEIFVPILDRLGIFSAKRKLEDLSFCYLFPKKHKEIKKQLDKEAEKREEYLGLAAEEIEKLLTDNSIEARVEGRVKGICSIHRKLKRKEKNYIDEIFDIFALRVVVKNQDDCYRALGLVHSRWKPLPRKFKDYIAMPKVNGYRSLHTVVSGLGALLKDSPVEIQIRTEEMHREAEYGIAAHWWHKETGAKERTPLGMLEERRKEYMDNPVYKDKLKWVKSLVDLHEKTERDIDFEHSLRLNFFSDRIFVLTPHGDVKDLPRGSTPIDFAYAVHTDVGHHCVRAEVDGNIIPLDSELENGQTIKIHVDKRKSPNRYWLSFVETTRAKEKIRSWFLGQDRDESIKQGVELLNRHLRRLGKEKLDKDFSLLKTLKEGKALKEREEILEDLGKGAVTIAAIIKKIFSPGELFLVRRKQRGLAGRKRGKKKGERKVLIEGKSDYPIKLAACCNPQEGDKIIGYIPRGGGVTVHKRSCHLIEDLNPRRFVMANWEGEEAEDKMTTYIEIDYKNRVGILNDLTGVIRELNLQILNLHRIKKKDHNIIFMEIEIFDYEQLDRLLSKLEVVEDVFVVKRLKEDEIKEIFNL